MGSVLTWRALIRQVVVRETSGWTEVREMATREWDFTGCFEPDSPLPSPPASHHSQVRPCV